MDQAGSAFCSGLLQFLRCSAGLPVLATGIIAWLWELEGQRLKGVLLMHLVLGCLSSALIWIVWLIHVRPTKAASSFAGVPLADRGCGRTRCDIDGPPGRVPQQR